MSEEKPTPKTRYLKRILLFKITSREETKYFTLRIASYESFKNHVSSILKVEPSQINKITTEAEHILLEEDDDFEILTEFSMLDAYAISVELHTNE